MTQERTALIIGGGRGNDGDIHTANSVDRILVDLVEHGLFRQTEGVVTVTVELLGRQTAEVADTRKSSGEKTIEEFPHTIA